MMRCIALISLVVLAWTAAAEPPGASLAHAGWLIGSWEGEGLDGFVQEVWTEPRGGAMMGSFRLVRDQEVSFYELFTLVEKDGGLELRLKHFDADLTAWEERTEVVTFTFESAEPGVLRFKGLVFQRLDEERMQVDLRLRSEDGNVRTEVFHFRRAALGR